LMLEPKVFFPVLDFSFCSSPLLLLYIWYKVHYWYITKLLVTRELTEIIFIGSITWSLDAILSVSHLLISW
jgi:hypothetical protein